MYETVYDVRVPEKLKGRPAQRDVYVAIAQAEGLFRPSELAEETGRTIDSVNGALSALLEEHLIEKPEHGKYRLAFDGAKESDLAEEDLDLQPVPEVEFGAGDDVEIDTINGNLVLPRSYIRSEYGVQPERLVIMRVRGRSMVDTLQPGQKVLGARQEGQDLENDTIYGLRSTLGFSVKRLRFDWENGERVIWILPDNPEQKDQNHYLTRSEFAEEYDVVAKALEVGKKL